MLIDLVAAEEAVKKLKLDLGLSHRASCIDVELWNHSTGTRELRVKIHVFDKDDICRAGRELTWELALEAVKLAVLGTSADPGTQPITVKVNAGEG